MAKAATRQRSAVARQFVVDSKKGAASPDAEAQPTVVAPVTRVKLAPRYDASLLAARPAAASADLTVGPAPDDDGLPPSRSTYAEERAAAEPFGAWLVRQKGRAGLLGQLATAAAGDRTFSKTASPDDLRKRLVEQQAEGDMHAALDDAEIDWLAL